MNCGKEQCVLLGKDHDLYGIIDACQWDTNGACAISVGADTSSPSFVFKQNTSIPNEDALFVAKYSENLVFVIADAHYGHWASHALVEVLQQNQTPFHTTQSVLSTLESISENYTESYDYSETTLIVSLVNTLTGEGSGVSYGDSSILTVNTNGVFQLNEKNSNFVSLNRPNSFESHFAHEFNFKMQLGDTLILFTDGIDECHYGHPETSINQSHIQKLYSMYSNNIVTLTQSITQMALDGVDGNPGGQDNIAIAAYQYKRT